MKTRIANTNAPAKYVPQPGDFFTWANEPSVVCLAIHVDDSVIGTEGPHKLTGDRLPHIEFCGKPRLQKFSKTMMPGHEFTKMKLVGFEAGELVFERE